MNNSKNLAIAALMGLMGAGAVANTALADPTMVEMNGPGSKFAGMEKHACKGQNSCAHNGGGDAAHFGKNACKGQGSCATDGSK